MEASTSPQPTALPSWLRRELRGYALPTQQLVLEDLRLADPALRDRQKVRGRLAFMRSDYEHCDWQLRRAEKALGERRVQADPLKALRATKIHDDARLLLPGTDPSVRAVQVRLALEKVKYGSALASVLKQSYSDPDTLKPWVRKRVEMEARFWSTFGWLELCALGLLRDGVKISLSPAALGGLLGDAARLALDDRLPDEERARLLNALGTLGALPELQDVLNDATQLALDPMLPHVERAQLVNALASVTTLACTVAPEMASPEAAERAVEALRKVVSGEKSAWSISKRPGFPTNDTIEDVRQQQRAALLAFLDRKWRLGRDSAPSLNKLLIQDVEAGLNDTFGRSLRRRDPAGRGRKAPRPVPVRLGLMLDRLEGRREEGAAGFSKADLDELMDLRSMSRVLAGLDAELLRNRLTQSEKEAVEAVERRLQDAGREPLTGAERQALTRIRRKYLCRP